MPGSSRGARPPPRRSATPVASSTARAVLVFLGSCVVTLGAGLMLELSGDKLATRAGINGVIFGATALAGASALPEISAGIAAVRLGHHQLSVADIFGGNAFQVCLFLLADVISGRPVLPSSGDRNVWLAGLGIVLTIVYACGVIIRPSRCYFRLGIDSVVVIGVLALGIPGLIAVSHG
jgi:cation:H+ antiporter